MNIYENEYKKIESELLDLQGKLKDCTKGSLRKRMIKGREYYYLQYREDGHVRSDYIALDKIESIRLEIAERKRIEVQIKQLQERLIRYAKLIGIHRSYRPVRNVNYDDYTLFMSTVAHDYKTLGRESFIVKYDVSKYRGINKRYLAGFLDYVSGIERHNMRKTNDLVLDPYTYLMYYKYGDKDALNEELKRAIPAFLNRGLLITNVQEAVNGSFDK